jgi:DNA replication protein DnaC
MIYIGDKVSEDKTMYDANAPDIDIREITKQERIRENEKQARYQHELMARRFGKLCPPLYQESDETRFPTEWERIKQWKYGPKGLMLVGPTRNCKSRMAWRIVRREFMAGKKVITYSDVDWGAAVSYHFKDPALTSEWLNKIGSVDILFLDDPFKRTLSDVQIEAIFAVFEKRAANMLPIICVQNATSQMIREMMKAGDGKAADLFEPLMQRMKEFCDVVVVKERK